jgi:transposase
MQHYGEYAMARRKLSTFERLQRGERLNRKERREVQQRLSLDDPGLDIIHRDAAGIDVGNESHFVSVPPDRDSQPIRAFGSWTAGLEEMARWLKQCRIRTVVMRSTGVYWIALPDVLQRHGLEVNLVDARGTKNVPGRKSDVQECQWLWKFPHLWTIASLFFAPTRNPRSAHALAVAPPARLRCRTEHPANAKGDDPNECATHNALSDISGVSGQTIIRALQKGEWDAKVPARLRDPRCQASEEEIVQSLQGNWKEDVLFELQQAVDAYDFYQRQMENCDQQLQRYMAALPTRTTVPAPASTLPSTNNEKKDRTRKPRKPKPHQPAFDLAIELQRTLGVDATTIDGIDVITMQTILAEIGPDLSAWKTEQHWTSWLNLAPKRDVSGGRLIRHVRQHHTNRVGNAFRMAAQSLVRSESYLGGSPLPIFPGQVGRTESRQSDGTLLGLSLLSTAHPRTDLGRPGYPRI